VNGELEPARDRTGLIVIRPGAPREPGYADIDFSITEDTAQALAEAVPANTARAYRRAWDDFAAWCADEGRVILPATSQTLTQYVRTLIKRETPLAPATIEQAIGVIRATHRDAGYPKRPGTTEAVKILRSYRRERSRAGKHVRQRAPLLIPAVRVIVATCDPETAAGVRDRALILLGFAMMSRRSELAARNLEDITDSGHDGIRVLIGHSKTDQDAEGASVAIPYGRHASTCPVRAVRAWTGLLAARGLGDGALFRPVDRNDRIGGEPGFAGKSRDRLTGHAVDAIVRRRAALAGVEDAHKYGGHSLRSGAASAAYAAGSPVAEIAKHGRWSPASPVVLGYIRAVDQWRDNPMKEIGL
jgi:integrase